MISNQPNQVCQDISVSASPSNLATFAYMFTPVQLNTTAFASAESMSELSNVAIWRYLSMRYKVPHDGFRLSFDPSQMPTTDSRNDL